MDPRVSVHWRGTLRDYLRRRRHTALLVAIVAAFAVRPVIGDNNVAIILFSLAMLVLMLLALYTIQVDELVGDRARLLIQRRRRQVVAWALAIVATAERLAMIVSPSRRLYLVGSICWLLFLAFVTWSQLRSLLKHKEVTTETISMSISIYLLLGLTWGLLYAVMFEMHPEAFSFGTSTTPNAVLHDIFPILIYFSLTTVSTIGFGDITPVSLVARYAAVAEGITGQFYLAILVARLVGMHLSQSVSRDVSDQRSASETTPLDHHAAKM
jgi:voltage-gated potassium channel